MWGLALVGYIPTEYLDYQVTVILGDMSALLICSSWQKKQYWQKNNSHCFPPQLIFTLFQIKPVCMYTAKSAWTLIQILVHVHLLWFWMWSSICFLECKGIYTCITSQLSVCHLYNNSWKQFLGITCMKYVFIVYSRAKSHSRRLYKMLVIYGLKSRAGRILHACWLWFTGSSLCWKQQKGCFSWPNLDPGSATFTEME